jgi:hypothetical protein
MRKVAATLGLAAAVSAAACGPRQVEVRTAPTQSAEVSVHFTNNLSSAVNVYVNTGSTDMFLRQVNAKTVEHMPVPGVSIGTRATLKAVPVGAQSGGYQRTGITMTAIVSWTVP